MKVDNGIANAIDAYLVENNLTAKQFAEKVGITGASMVMWRRVGRGITGKWWKVVFPLIKKYLPKNRIYVGSDGEEHYASAEDASDNSFGLASSAVAKVPLLDEYAIRSYTPMAESIESFATKAGLPRVYHLNKSVGVGGVFAHVLKESTNGIPAGATVFASTEARPTDGNTVIAVRVTGEICIGSYYLNDGNVTFAGVKFPAVRLRELFTIFSPVVRYEVNML